jgi:DNA polymerase/3'-5' exonuclease PolX
MPSGSKGAALVGTTGDVEFVRHMRSQASKAGARLNDHGLWRRPKGWTWSEKSDTKSDTEWELVETPREEDVFRELGLDSCVEPARRNLGYIVPGNSRREK